MRSIGHFFVALTALAVSFVAEAKPVTQTFEVEVGSYTVKPARCNTAACKLVVYQLKGNFSAEIEGHQIRFPASNLTSSPDNEFQLPENPETDEGGTVRKIDFSFKNDHITLQGSEDMRAFDGPLIEYQISARATGGTADFGPLNFYTARPDFRKCAAPACGGYFIKSVNSLLTRCAGGKLKLECYVAEIEYGKGGLSGATSGLQTNPYLIQGQLVNKKYENGSRWGFFKATSAYVALGNQSASGVFAAVQNNGIMCITSPCFSYDQFVLNSKRVRALSGVDFSDLQAQGVDLEKVQSALAEGEFVLAAGKNHQTLEMAGPGLAFIINNVYWPIKPE